MQMGQSDQPLGLALERWVSRPATLRARGFTLIELLIVIAIVGILAAVFVPMWANRNDPTAVLKTNDWQCLKTEPRRYSYIVMVGKVPVTNYGTRDECVEWKRVAG
jgi:prepilin-type N-terminal cleavage/methylation domain-containing protein